MQSSRCCSVAVSLVGVVIQAGLPICGVSHPDTLFKLILSIYSAVQHLHCHSRRHPTPSVALHKTYSRTRSCCQLSFDVHLCLTFATATMGHPIRPFVQDTHCEKPSPQNPASSLPLRSFLAAPPTSQLGGWRQGGAAAAVAGAPPGAAGARGA